MATATEVSSVIDWIKERWPSASGFRHWERVARDFALIPVESMYAAAQNHYRAGNRTAPTFSELRSEAARIAAERGTVDPQAVGCDVKGHSRNWAIADLGRSDADGNPLREAMCLDCHTVIIRPAHHLRTVGEVAEEAKRGREDPAKPNVRGPVYRDGGEFRNPGDTETDRISP